MLGIEQIASYLPGTRVDNLAQATRLGAQLSFVAEKIGVEQFRKFDKPEPVVQACVQAYGKLIEKLGEEPTAIDCIVVCTQNPDKGGLPHNSALVHGKLDLGDECACFDVGLGCSGYVYGLSVVSSFMKLNGLKRGLLFTCDPYTSIVHPDDKSTSLLFGDAATVTLVSDSPKYVELKTVFATRGGGSNALERDNGCLRMNGRQVFNFALVEVPRQIESLLQKVSLRKEEIDLFLLHQGSKFMLENVLRRAGIPPDHAPIMLTRTGNTVSSSIPLLFERYLQDKPERVLMSGFGVGLSWASCVYESNSDD